MVTQCCNFFFEIENRALFSLYLFFIRRKQDEITQQQGGPSEGHIFFSSNPFIKYRVTARGRGNKVDTATVCLERNV